MDAEIIVKFRATNVCDPADLTEPGMTLSFEELVRYMVQEVGLTGMVEEPFEVLSIKEVTNVLE